MRLIYLFLFLVTFSGFSFSQSDEYQGLLWEISGNGLEQPSYLYGTMHVSNKVAFHLSDSFYMAIKDVDVVALEINPEIWMETMTSDPYIADQMGNAFSIRGDYATEGFYKAIFKLESPENSVIGAALGQELGILNSLLYRTNSFNAEFQEDTYLDLFIYQAGRKLGKEVTGLENLGTTMRLSERAVEPEDDPEIRKKQKEDLQRKRHEIQKLLKDKSFSEVMEDAYRQGDLNLLDSLSRLSNINDKYHQLMIVKRNKGMARGMDSIMQTQRLFAGVGAAHLPNTYGVINLLREMGYNVRPIGNVKSEYGREFKDDLEETFLKKDFDFHKSFDGSFGVSLPGPLYEFPESSNAMMAAFPDMANGATYVVTRILTFAPLHGLSQEQYMDKIDSLLYENIPGKILEETRIEIDGVPGFDIINETKKGDVQRYHIMVTPLELIIFKVGGKKEFVRRTEVAQFFDDLTFYTKPKGHWTDYSPRNNAYAVKLPGTPVYESEDNAFERGFWKKTVQSYDEHDESYFAVLNRSYSDMRFMEVDSFELGEMARSFVRLYKYDMVDWRLDSFQGNTSYEVHAKKTGMPALHLKLIAKSDQYYMLVAQSSNATKANRFIESFSFKDFEYERKFETRSDSNCYFTVVSPVDAVKTNNYYNSYYYSEEEEDNTHEEETKNVSYYCAETDESVFVGYKKFHKYYFETDIDSIWRDKKEDLTEEGNFYIHKERSWTSDNKYYYEAEATDTNSGRNLLGRFILKDGALYSLYSEVDKHGPKSRFIQEFYSTFQPWDTSIGTPVLENKTAIFLADLRSKDSLTHQAAFRSFDVIHFEDSDFPMVKEAIEASYPFNHTYQIRVELLEKLMYMKNEQMLPYLETKFYAVEDSVNYQLPILKAIAGQQTKKSTRLFSELLLAETPLTSQSYEISKLFYSFDDSLNLVEDLYPDLLLLASLPEYNYKVYSYLAMARQQGIVSKRLYRKQLKQIVWEANNQIKRQKAAEASLEKDFYSTAPRYKLYSYDYSLYNYASLLLPWEKRNKKVQKFFTRLDQLNSVGLEIDIAVLKAKNGMDVPENTWLDIAANDNHRIELYDDLERQDLLKLFPEEYSDQMSLAISEFADLNNLNIAKDSVTFVKRELTVIDGDTGYIYFYKIKDKYGDNWHMGYLGLMSTDTTSFDFEQRFSDDNMIYNKFEDLDLQIELQIRKLQMEDHPRYRVEDEERFKNLNVSRRYGY
ncbi:TraB/GumN family protein [bacterium]|nr:TraB/GumN family protein [bacterium]